ncbi:hypothetical protein [Streptomyces sp. NRRL F-5126]|uniref:hypothetical protein n=1 Tax=Streptomyces sp. NRRL F-5126 TaxID=1463857 RepID=UPI0004C88B48|nr:hypothetical protein [Streptomyces sp. NRRL F-5126]
MGRIRLWWKPVLAGVIGLLGILSLAGTAVSVAGGRAHLADLRAHGVHAAGEARVMTHCGGGRRSYSCSTEAVRLDFTDARGRSRLVREKPVASFLYVPHGKAGADLSIATTVVYDASDPAGAQPAAALDQSVLDLARHRTTALVVALLMALLGVGAALGTWPSRTARFRPSGT